MGPANAKTATTIRKIQNTVAIVPKPEAILAPTDVYFTKR